MCIREALTNRPYCWDCQDGVADGGELDEQNPSGSVMPDRSAGLESTEQEAQGDADVMVEDLLQAVRVHGFSFGTLRRFQTFARFWSNRSGFSQSER